jgi:ATP-dependent DNA helicase RecG
LASVPQLDSPVRMLPGVGNRIEPRLARIGIATIGDLLFHLPFRYLDKTHLAPIGTLRHGQEALVQGTVELAQIRYGGRRSLLCRISDGTGALMLRFFHFNRAQQAGMERGRHIRCWGQARRGQNAMEMIHPEYQFVAEDELDRVDDCLTPVYPATEGVSQGLLRRLVERARESLEANPASLQELIPRKLLEGLRLPSLREALQTVHSPPPHADTSLLLEGRHPAQRRLAFEELLAHQVSLRMLRSQVRELRAPALDGAGNLAEQAEAKLPFRLTRSQSRVLGEVRRDLCARTPMMRLVQGDVGCGKTVVAALAAVQAVSAGYQAALMAPTELLAEQHAAGMRSWVEDAGIEIFLLTGSLKRRDRSALLPRLARGDPVIATGTHALFQQGIVFGRLGLVIVDEQHRFGVHQRLALLEKGAAGDVYPHQLIMTATPIPRTLAMTVFADLDVSVIDELPPGRRPVRTHVISVARRAEIIGRIESACAGGRQAYWVCPLIEESDALQCRAAVDTRRSLVDALPGRRIGLLHGRMKPAEKQREMRAFKAGDADVLVATTVIEVGVDVPNASLMIVENAERLGLSQLHQLRGRVGRGTRDSDCVLMYQPPLGDTARERLETMRLTTDGFRIAEKDLELRGPGELLGARQTGMQSMRVANLARDARMIPQVQRAAEALIRYHPDLVDPLVRRWVTVDQNLGAV